jgi:hypothetical protein
MVRGDPASGEPERGPFASRHSGERRSHFGAIHPEIATGEPDLVEFCGHANKRAIAAATNLSEN